MEKAFQDYPRKKTRWELILALTCFAQAIFLTGYFFSSAHDHHQTPALPGQLTSWTDCGLSPREARARNCHFDSMLYAWIPGECFHPEPLDEYRPFKDRTWYTDVNLTQPMSDVEIEELSAGSIPIAYTHTYHHEHCLYAMRKLAMATDKRWLLIDGKSADVHHATHCGKQIAQFVKGTIDQTFSPGSDHHAMARLQFPGCVAMPWRL